MQRKRLPSGVFDLYKFLLIMITIISLVGLFSCSTENLQHLRKYLAAAPSGNNAKVTGQFSPNHELEQSKRQQPNITKAKAARIAEAYKAGKSTKQLAVEFKRSRATISASLKRSGVEMRTFRQSSPEEIKQMVDLYKSGLSLVKVAERVGYSEKAVWTQLRNAGVRLRGTHGE